MKQQVTAVLAGVCLLAILSTTALAQGKGATRVENAIWANGIIYSTVLTPTSFNLPPMHSTDTLYNFMMSGLKGQRSVSESAPGDRDFNGGRWAVKMVVFTSDGIKVHDPDGDGSVNFELTNAAEVLHHASLGHLEIMDTQIYFECPLLRSK